MKGFGPKRGGVWKVSMDLESYGDGFLASAFDVCPVGMLATDSAGNIILVNREIERLFGYSRDELVGRSVELLVPERYREAHPSFRSDYLANPRTLPVGMAGELFGLRKDGREVPVEIGLNPVHTEHGVVLLASVVDISARRTVEDQLRQSQKMEAIGTLAGGIAHDFNNILLAITGHAELAQRAKVLDAQHADDLEQVLHAADRGRQLVQRILTFSRVRSINRTQISTERVLRETLQLLRASLPATVEIREVFDPDTPDLFADETQVQQVLMNLVTNAAHAMPNGGELEVAVTPLSVDNAFARAHSNISPGSYVHISVSDNGVGMPDDVVARAFEPFFTTKPNGKGTGLGLSVTLGIVQSHGGAIDIRTKPGEGTRVDVYLPSAKAGALQDSTPDRRKHILLVDDDPRLAMMMKRQLEGIGYRVSMHVSSTDALRAFQREPEAFDLLATDNTMPRLTGLMLTREILAIRPDLPVLLISGVVQAAEPEALQGIGVTRALPKPHTMREFEAAVQSLIGPPEAG
jgi:PAS domain S-box-containing protein